MTRSLKMLGLMLVSMFALGALTAPAASAENGKLTSDGPVTLDMHEFVSGQVLFAAFGESLSCAGSVYTGHAYNVTPHEFIPSGASTITITPDFDQASCQTTGGGGTHKATVTMNGCDIVLHIGETFASDEYNVTSDWVCPGTASAVVDVYFSASNENLKVCEVTVGPQSGLSGAKVKTDTEFKDLDLREKYPKLGVSKSGLCGSGSEAGAEFNTSLTVTGTNQNRMDTGITVTDGG